MKKNTREQRNDEKSKDNGKGTKCQCQHTISNYRPTFTWLLLWAKINHEEYDVAILNLKQKSGSEVK